MCNQVIQRSSCFFSSPLGCIHSGEIATFYFSGDAVALSYSIKMRQQHPFFLPSNTNVISLTAAVMVISHLDYSYLSPLTVSIKKVTPQRGWGSSRML